MTEIRRRDDFLLDLIARDPPDLPGSNGDDANDDATDHNALKLIRPLELGIKDRVRSRLPHNVGMIGQASSDSPHRVIGFMGRRGQLPPLGGFTVVRC